MYSVFIIKRYIKKKLNNLFAVNHELFDELHLIKKRSTTDNMKILFLMRKDFKKFVNEIPTLKAYEFAISLYNNL